MAEANEEKLHFLDYWRVIRSRWEIVIAVTLIVALTGIAITVSLPKVYMASTRILIEHESPDMSAFYQRASSDYNPYFLRTQYEIIQSRPILEDVIRKLDLLELWGKYGRQTPTMQVAYRKLRGMMKVQQYRDTNLVEIQIYVDTPKESMPWKLAADIADEVATAYREYRLSIKHKEMKRGIESLREEFDKQREKVVLAEKRVHEERKKAGITMVGDVQLDKSGLHQLEGNRISARVDMLVRKARLDQVQGLDGKDLLDAVQYIVQDAQLAALQSRLAEYSVSLSLLRENYGEKHPDVMRAKAGIRELENKIDEALKGLRLGLNADYEIARAKFETLDAELEAAKASDISAEDELYRPFMNAQRDLGLQRQILAALETRLSQEGIEMELPRTPVEIIDGAEPSVLPVRPNLLLNMFLSIFLGLGAGVGLAYLLEYLDTSVKNVEEIERLVGLPVLGVVPQKVPSLLDVGPDSPHAEAYRVLRTNMLFSSRSAGANTFCLTSGGAGEGKSLTLCNLAYVSALLGDRVLVVDSDFRRPSQHRLFHLPNDRGLTDVLMNEVSVEDVILPTKQPNLEIIVSGRVRSAAFGLLDSSRMLELVKKLKVKYDYVFFDAPPVGVSDASVLASEVDGVLLVIQHRKYPRVLSTRAKTIVENVGGNLIGVVLNNINIARDYYSYYHYTYHSYQRAEGEIRERT